VLVAWLNLGAGLVLAACLLVAGVAGPWLTMRAARLAEGAAAEARAEISAAAMAMVDGAAELTVSGRLRDVVMSLRGTERDLARAKDAAARPAALAAGVDTLAMGAAVLGSLVLGIPATVAGSMEAVELAVIVLTPLAAFEGTAMLGPAAVQLVRSSGSAVRIMELLDRAGPATGAAHAAASPVEPAAPSPGPRLTARGLAVGWPGGPVVAEGIDLDLAPGRAVAVVGPSGIGKTTLLLTLAGLLPPRAGTVELNGVPVWEADRHRVSADLVLTAEDAHVFGTTVLENLRVARGDVTEREAAGLLDRAGLGDWLAGLPDGLATMLGPDAATVSGGERRRLLLARALASPARLLLLDEPGEHLDPATADRLLTDLLRTGVDDGDAPRGVVLVTHRLSPLGAAEEVIVLGARNDGPATVLARGTHERLRADVPAYRWALEQEEHR
jgi:ATP-binding cassette subfamily C protein CydC